MNEIYLTWIVFLTAVILYLVVKWFIKKLKSNCFYGLNLLKRKCPFCGKRCQETVFYKDFKLFTEYKCLKCKFHDIKEENE